MILAVIDVSTINTYSFALGTFSLASAATSREWGDVRAKVLIRCFCCQDGLRGCHTWLFSSSSLAIPSPGSHGHIFPPPKIEGQAGETPVDPAPIPAAPQYNAVDRQESSLHHGLWKSSYDQLCPEERNMLSKVQVTTQDLSVETTRKMAPNCGCHRGCYWDNRGALQGISGRRYKNPKINRRGC